MAKASENTAQEDRHYIDSTQEKLPITSKQARVDCASGVEGSKYTVQQQGCGSNKASWLEK